MLRPICEYLYAEFMGKMSYLRDANSGNFIVDGQQVAIVAQTEAYQFFAICLW
jgi:hypothetical protein